MVINHIAENIISVVFFFKIEISWLSNRMKNSNKKEYTIKILPNIILLSL